MKLAQSRVTAQGQVSVPAAVRRRLGLAPGSTIEWNAEGDTIVVRRALRYSSEEIHRAIFPEGPGAPRARAELKEGIREHLRRRHARH